MKRLIFAVVLAFLGAAAASAQNSPAAKAPGRVVRCRDDHGRPCTAKQIQTLSDTVFAGKQQHDALADFKQLTLVSADGVLKCARLDGSACTSPQLDLVKQLASTQNLYINFNTPEPAGR